MKLVVTGGAGHVSKPLTELLLREGHDVTVVGRKAENFAGRNRPLRPGSSAGHRGS